MKPLRSFARAWRIASRTPIVVVPAALAAAIWALVLAPIGDVDHAPDLLVDIAYFALYASTACSIAFIAALAAGPDEPLLIVVRRAGPAVPTACVLGLIGTTIAVLLHSFLGAWFLSAFFFLYAIPLVISRKAHWTTSIFASARLAISRIWATFLAAAIIESIAVVALTVGFEVSSIVYIGDFVQSFVLQLAMGFFAVFATAQYGAIEQGQPRPNLHPAVRRSSPGDGTPQPT